MRAESYDVAVVGLGLIGSGALRHLAGSGASVVGIGPGEPANFATHRGPFASHYDSGRITRHLDPVREWAVLAARAIADYPTLEAESGIGFHRPVGVVLAELDPARVSAIETVADQLGIDLNVSNVATNPFPALAFAEGSTLLSEPGPAGFIDPRRMLAANLAVAAQRGATTIEESAAAIEERRGRGWRLITDSGRVVHTDRVLITTGPHTDELAGVPPLPPATVRGETVVQATLGPAEQRRLDGLPSVLARIVHCTYDDLYLVPPTIYPDGSVRLKLGATRTHIAVLSDAARRRGWMRGNAHGAELDELRSLTEQLVPGLAADAWETKPCIITETPTGLPYLDHVADTMVVAFGGNGYAAKSANAIGSLAVDLMMAGRWTDADLSAAAFRVPRAIGGLSIET